MMVTILNDKNDDNKKVKTINIYTAYIKNAVGDWSVCGWHVDSCDIYYRYL